MATYEAIIEKINALVDRLDRLEGDVKGQGIKLNNLENDYIESKATIAGNLEKIISSMQEHDKMHKSRWNTIVAPLIVGAMLTIVTAVIQLLN